MCFSQRKVELMDMTGKVVLVTGGNHGIGYFTVKHLVLRGATVYLAARNEGKAKDAIESLEQEVLATAAKARKADTGAPSPGTIIFHHCDLSTPAQAKESAERFMEQESRLDVLINNAASLPVKDSIDQMMIVNHFSTLQFTQSLLPLLLKTAKTEPDVRIVTVSSDGYHLTRGNNPNIQFKTWDDYNADYSSDIFPGFSKYCVSKLAGLVALKALQRRLLNSYQSDEIPQSNIITCIALHPGEVNTFSDWLFLGWLFKPLLDLFLTSPEAGAFNSVFAAASVEVARDKKKYQGAYLHPVGKLTEVSKVVASEALQDELWESTERILKDWPEVTGK